MGGGKKSRETESEGKTGDPAKRHGSGSTGVVMELCSLAEGCPKCAYPGMGKVAGGICPESRDSIRNGKLKKMNMGLMGGWAE